MSRFFNGKLVVTLILALIHVVAGLSLLLVSSWFIAACAVAGINFNYMLPAVVIRALAILRIASGYFSMLFGHDHLLSSLALLRLSIFARLQHNTSINREDALGALHHSSEDIAAVWIAWVSQTAGTLVSLLLINLMCLYLLPTLGWISLGLSVVFSILYILLLTYLTTLSADLVQKRNRCQFDIVNYIEAASIWHLMADFKQQSPQLKDLHELISRMQLRIRIASTILSIIAWVLITITFVFYSAEYKGDALFILLPIVLLSVNDWLSPSLVNQKTLLDFVNAKKQLQISTASMQQLSLNTSNITSIELNNFKAQKTIMPTVNMKVKANSLSVLEGTSGIGKSRFLQALIGLLPYQGERIFEDSDEIACKHESKGCLQRNSEGLMTKMCYVEQFPYLLSDTLRENLLLANRQASDTQLFTALKRVGLEKLNDLECWIGENGRPLSGGERKRLGLARALLSEGSVILIDEPFEALDQANIHRVVNLLNNMAKDKIVIVATHLITDDLRYDQRIQLDKK